MGWSRHAIVTSLGVVVLGLTSTACSSDADTPGTTEASAPTAAASPAQNSGAFLDNEIRGDIATGSLWALFYHRRSDEPLKTIWRMTGTGDLSVEATGPRGQTIHPDGVPEPHAGSNWDRPGDEWGVFWTIPQPGRWTFHAKRGDGRSGTVTVDFS